MSGARYPASSWYRHWDGLTAFFKYPVEFRRLIYTTNAIESLHPQSGRTSPSRKMFPDDGAVIRILFLNILNLFNRWSRRRGWDIVMNQLTAMFGDRLNRRSLTDCAASAPPSTQFPLQSGRIVCRQPSHSPFSNHVDCLNAS